MRYTYARQRKPFATRLYTKIKTRGYTNVLFGFKGRTQNKIQYVNKKLDFYLRLEHQVEKRKRATIITFVILVLIGYKLHLLDKAMAQIYWSVYGYSCMHVIVIQTIL